MKQLIAIFALLLFIGAHNPYRTPAANLSPLHEYSPEWDQSKYQQCNTASGVGYMTGRRKECCMDIEHGENEPGIIWQNSCKAIS